MSRTRCRSARVSATPAPAAGVREQSRQPTSRCRRRAQRVPLRRNRATVPTLRAPASRARAMLASSTRPSRPASAGTSSRQTNRADLARDHALGRAGDSDGILGASAADIEDADAFAAQRSERRQRAAIRCRRFFFTAQHAQRNSHDRLDAIGELFAIFRPPQGARSHGKNPHVVPADRAISVRSTASSVRCIASSESAPPSFNPSPTRVPIERASSMRG